MINSPTTSHPSTHPKNPRDSPIPRDSRRLARCSGRRISHLPRGATGPLLRPQKLVVFLPTKRAIYDSMEKMGVFLEGLFFFLEERATKNIWYSTGCYCNVFVPYITWAAKLKNVCKPVTLNKVTREISLKIWQHPKLIRSDSVRFFSTKKTRGNQR